MCVTGTKQINPHFWLVPRNMQDSNVLAGALPAPASLPTLQLLS